MPVKDQRQLPNLGPSVDIPTRRTSAKASTVWIGSFRQDALRYTRVTILDQTLINTLVGWFIHLPRLHPQGEGHLGPSHYFVNARVVAVVPFHRANHRRRMVSTHPWLLHKVGPLQASTATRASSLRRNETRTCKNGFHYTIFQFQLYQLCGHYKPHIEVKGYFEWKIFLL